MDTTWPSLKKRMDRPFLRVGGTIFFARATSQSFSMSTIPGELEKMELSKAPPPTTKTALKTLVDVRGELGWNTRFRSKHIS